MPLNLNFSTANWTIESPSVSLSRPGSAITIAGGFFNSSGIQFTIYGIVLNTSTLVNFNHTLGGIDINFNIPNTSNGNQLVIDFDSGPLLNQTTLQLSGLNMDTGEIYLSVQTSDHSSYARGAISVTAGDTKVIFSDPILNHARLWNITLESGGTNFSLSRINCFLAGSLLQTESGDRAIEQLKAGDKVYRSDGSLTTVKWVGYQEVSTRLTHPAKVNPICIARGALGENVPNKDLHISQDHALEVEGLLINAGALVNGKSIYQVAKMPREGFRYYHIETEGHELLNVQGLAAESFIDYVGREGFVGTEGQEIVGEPIREMNLPRLSAARLVPPDIRERLAQRAELTSRQGSFKTAA